MVLVQYAGLYLHVPFCGAICPYCDYAVCVDEGCERSFVRAAIREMEANSDWDTPFETLYLGGGTPSRLSIGASERLIDGCLQAFEWSQDPWIGLEANPEDVEKGLADAWRELGVRAVYLGVQSFDEEMLRRLGRAHRADESLQAVDFLRNAGLETVSIELLYGLRGQTVGNWRQDLDRALALAPDHLSCYELAGKGSESDPDRLADLFDLTHGHLNDSAMEGYEVSHFARSPSHRSRHTMRYWRHEPYLGLGPSSHSYRDARRWWNLRGYEDWREAVQSGRSPIDSRESLEPRELLAEALLLGLRNYEGVDPSRVSALTGIALDAYALDSKLDLLVEQGFLRIEDEMWRPTLKGLRTADWLAVELLRAMEI